MGVWIQLVAVMIVIGVPGWAAASEARIEVDANLITALDTSASVGRFEESVEQEGLASAIAHPRFLEAVRTGPHKRIGFAVFTWSSHGHTKTVIPWTIIASPDDATRLSQHLLSINLIGESQLLDRDIPTDHYEAPNKYHLTDIALAIHASSALLASAPTISHRSVINIVGSGTSNSGMEPAEARDAALEAKQVVNALVVGYGLTSDVEYYRTHVIGGPGSFVMQVSNPLEMTEAFLTKFRLDIAGLNESTLSKARHLAVYQMPDDRKQ
jgi:Ca-activated chloride channel family protein